MADTFAERQAQRLADYSDGFEAGKAAALASPAPSVEPADDRDETIAQLTRALREAVEGDAVTEARIAKHALPARECPPGVMVLTAYAVRRILGLATPHSAAAHEPEPCRSCNGSGEVSRWDTSRGPDGHEEFTDCPECKGTGAEPRAFSCAYREALGWILPMAKGYAHEHPVGRNASLVEHAESILAEVQDHPAQAIGGGKDGPDDGGVRAQFEASFLNYFGRGPNGPAFDRLGDFWLDRLDDGRYEMARVDDAWTGWLACARQHAHAASIPSKLARQDENESGGDSQEKKV